MKITVEVSGGFAAIPALSRPSTVDTASVNSQLAAELESLVRRCNFFAPIVRDDRWTKGAADYRTYTITVEDGPHSHNLQLREPIADSNLEQLVSRVRAIAAGVTQ
jgi:hypothetical protein